MKAVIYIRVSTKEQAEEGYSLASQRRQIKSYAKDKKFDIVRVFEIPESASGKQERKFFLNMMTFLKENPDVKNLLCEKVDRLTRNFRDAIVVDDWFREDEERKVHFVKQNLVIHKNSTSHETLQWDISLVLAKQYIKNLSEESQKGVLEKAREGWYPGNKKRGYKTVGDKGHKTWEIDEESDVLHIKEAFELYDTGEFTLSTLSKKMFKKGWTTINERPIPKSTMNDLLSDCFYCGEFVWNGRHYPKANHTELISKELFYRVQERMKRNITGKYRKHNFLLNGLITCGECGRSVIGEIQKGHHYYHCTRFKTNCSQRKFIREEDLETQLEELFGSLEVKNMRVLEWVRKALKANHSQEIDYHKKSLSSLNRQLSILQTRLDNLYEHLLDEKIDQQTYDGKFTEYTNRKAELLTNIQKHEEANIDYYELGSHIFELSQKAHQIYCEQEDPAKKRSLLSIVFSNLSLKDGKLLPHYQNAFQVVANCAENKEWLPRLDSN